MKKQRLPFSREPIRPGTTENLREVATQIHTPLLFAHVRASSGTPVQRSNCHPFRYGRWLWMHNGSLAGFDKVKRDLLMAVDESLYPEIEGSTDTEALFFLALTFGLADDPPPRSPAPSASPSRWADGTASTTRCT